MSVLPYQTQSRAPASRPTLRRRILRMSTVWAALGALMGASVGMQSGGTIGAITAMLAGIIELAALGAIFALVGGTPKETVVGAVGGLVAGLTVGTMGTQIPLVLVANFGMVVGAIAGATLRPYLRLLALPVILLGRLRRGHERPAVVASRLDAIGEPPSLRPGFPANPGPPRRSRRPRTHQETPAASSSL